MLNEHKAEYPKRERERETALKTNESGKNVTDKTHVTDKRQITNSSKNVTELTPLRKELPNPAVAFSIITLQHPGKL